MKKIIIFLFCAIFLNANYLEVKLGGAWPQDLGGAFKGEVLYGFDIDEIVSLNISVDYIGKSFDLSDSQEDPLGATYNNIEMQSIYSELAGKLSIRVSVPILLAEMFKPYAQVGAGFVSTIHNYRNNNEGIDKTTAYFGWVIDLRGGMNMKLGSKSLLFLTPGVMISKAGGKNIQATYGKLNLTGFYLLGGFGFVFK